jgi:enoyl-CoA hydratase
MKQRSGGILVRHEGDISTITFNRPERLNALDPATLLEFLEVIRDEDHDATTKAIVLTGEGPAFSVGADPAPIDSSLDHRVNRSGWHLVYRMLEVEKPIVAMVNGQAIGLGLTIALLSDLIIAAEDAVLGDQNVEHGSAAGDGVAIVLPLLIGPHRAKEFLLTGHTVTGMQAAELGIVNQAVPAQGLELASYAIAKELAGQPTYALRATKMVVNRYVRWMADQVLDVALAYEEISRGLPEYQETVERGRTRLQSELTVHEKGE